MLNPSQSKIFTSLCLMYPAFLFISILKISPIFSLTNILRGSSIVIISSSKSLSKNIGEARGRYNSVFVHAMCFSCFPVTAASFLLLLYISNGVREA